MTGPLLSIEEVAKTLGVSREWVRDHATRRNLRIPVVRLFELRGENLYPANHTPRRGRREDRRRR